MVLQFLPRGSVAKRGSCGYLYLISIGIMEGNLGKWLLQRISYVT